jgi:hypothetical protein
MELVLPPGCKLGTMTFCSSLPRCGGVCGVGGDALES